MIARPRTTAGLFEMILAFHRAGCVSLSDANLLLDGRPPWWRPLARRRWGQAMERAMARYVEWSR